MEKLVQMEALAEVTSAMRAGITFPVSEPGSKDVHIPFSELPRREKVGLLNSAVDWPLYSHFGLGPEQAWRIVENAADGRPQDQWLEPVQARHDQPARPCLDEIMKRCATTEKNIQRGKNHEHER
jgi:hypothetical protein